MTNEVLFGEIELPAKIRLKNIIGIGPFIYEEVIASLN